MKCNKVHNKLIFFLEKELPVSEMEQVQKHLDECSECALFAAEMKNTLSILDSDKVRDENPFFFTRVKARLENQAEEQLSARPVLTKVLQPVAFSIILLLGIYGGFKLGQAPKTDFADNSLSEQEMVPYWNELDAEPIESFLME
ncbi:anti-sigma factor family protein [Draconibacterium halophilum]|uniref:Zf-HC2 domain-containing protein n=1 Tax=Draconibacterium halophilum TaxID=2706887 RepID=A0A6C0RBD1_9BACT|nr:zf-HC2 domain-containing protein [Draconibacterium halophilum]QIA06783.1 zf-HC2 domain-containing protein [Draconibacterium halophilum]